MTVDQNIRDLACTMVSTFFSAEGSEDDMMIATLTTHLPDLARLPAIRDLVLASLREADAELIAKALHDNSDCGDQWPCPEAWTAEFYRVHARRITEALKAPRCMITLEQVKPDMRIRMEFSDEGVLREYTMLVKGVVPAGKGAWVSAKPTGMVWVPNNVKITWLDDTEPIDPDAEEIEAMAQAIYCNNSVRYRYTCSWDETTEESRNAHRDNARAALTAQRNHNNHNNQKD